MAGNARKKFQGLVRIRKVEGSIPFGSTILIAGRTPECEIIVLRYGFWLALDLTVQA